MNTKLLYALAVAAFGFAGIAIIAVYAGWQTALGVFICVWANNISNANINSE